MSHQKGALDTEALYTALDRKRRRLRISGREVTRQAGIPSSSTWSRLGQGYDVSADTLLRLLAWLGETDISPYSALVGRDA